MTDNAVTAALATGSAPIVPTGPSPALAAAKLEALMGNREFGPKLLAGDSAARREFDELNKVIAGGDGALADALKGVAAPSEPFAVQTVVDGELPAHALRTAVADLQTRGLADQAVAEVFSGKSFTAEEVRAAEQWRDRTMRDATSRAAYLKGDADLGRQMLVANAIIAAGIAV
jgi:hypothetical protein